LAGLEINSLPGTMAVITMPVVTAIVPAVNNITGWMVLDEVRGLRAGQ